MSFLRPQPGDPDYVRPADPYKRQRLVDDGRVHHGVYGGEIVGDTKWSFVRSFEFRSSMLSSLVDLGGDETCYLGVDSEFEWLLDMKFILFHFMYGFDQ